MRRLALAFALAAACAAPAGAETVSGRATVIDGDTLAFGERHVRLFGIDAPESAQTCDRDGQVWACGAEATRQLAGLVAAGRVDCAGSETDAYGRLVAVCWSGGYELNQSLVAFGWATAFRQYSDAYVADEARARADRMGIWSSRFEAPQAFRLAQETAREAPAKPAAAARPSLTRQVRAGGAFGGGCAIKGNHSRTGEWIYHLPGMPYYDATRPEAIFCTEAEALAAGYRRARAR